MRETLIRSASGIVYVTLVVILAMAGSTWLAGFMSIVAFGAWWEAAHLLKLSIRHPLRWVGVVIWAVLALSVFLHWPVGWAILLLAFTPFLFSFLPVAPVRIFIWMWLSQVSFFMLAMYALSPEYRMEVVLSLFVLIWVNDSMAYVGGKWLGKHKLAPTISPGKSWEGFFTGLFFSLALSMFLGFWLFREQWWIWVPLTGVMLVLAVVGDLAESWLKRRAGAKDSGHIMPGHGGFLDRFDSFLLSIPPIYYFLLQI
jgi:phosphatidate cytidylyltransferase